MPREEKPSKSSSHQDEAAELMPPARLRNLMLLVLTAGALYLCWLLVKPFVTVLLGSVALAVLFVPLHDRLLARLGKPNLAAFLTVGVVVLAVLLPLGLLGTAVVSELSSVLGNAPAAFDRLLANPDAKARASELLAEARRFFPGIDNVGREEIEAGMAKIGETVLAGSFGVLGRALGAAFRFVLIAFTLFFLLRDGDRLLQEVRELLPLSRRQGERIFSRATEVLRASAYGVVVVAVIQGVLGGVMLAVLGVPAPVLWAVVMTLAAMIPMVGAGAVWVPVTLLLFLTGQSGKAFILLGWGALVVSTVDNVLRPRLVAGRTRLHELVVFFGILGGLKVFGLVGVLVGPTIFALAAALLALVRERNGNSQLPARERQAVPAA